MRGVFSPRTNPSPLTLCFASSVPLSPRRGDKISHPLIAGSVEIHFRAWTGLDPNTRNALHGVSAFRARPMGRVPTSQPACCSDSQGVSMSAGTSIRPCSSPAPPAAETMAHAPVSCQLRPARVESLNKCLTNGESHVGNTIGAGVGIATSGTCETVRQAEKLSRPGSNTTVSCLGRERGQASVPSCERNCCG